MSENRILFLNANQAKSGYLEGKQLPQNYVSASTFFKCGIIDRTSILNQGFDYVVLDPIPNLTNQNLNFEQICDVVADETVSNAIKLGKKIRVFWSGGIDSTTALIALMKAATKSGNKAIVNVFLSIDSVHEYPLFYNNHIKEKFSITPIDEILNFFEKDFINITGEHGDQLFGSHLLEPYVIGGSAFMDYRDVLELIMTQRLDKISEVKPTIEYLQPQVDAAPVKIKTFFDFMWWLNFSLKWQQVTLRLPAYCVGNVEQVYQSTHHFFRDERFQIWALQRDDIRTPSSWTEYKPEAKSYILDFTGDEDYFNNKVKEPSLKRVLARSHLQVYMKEDYNSVIKQSDAKTYTPEVAIP
ncbi:MAG: hypothetical protein ACW99A_09005 [Candidatus Kariarchaeaceae archaeon]